MFDWIKLKLSRHYRFGLILSMRDLLREDECPRVPNRRAPSHAYYFLDPEKVTEICRKRKKFISHSS